MGLREAFHQRGLVPGREDWTFSDFPRATRDAYEAEIARSLDGFEIDEDVQAYFQRVRFADARGRDYFHPFIRGLRHDPVVMAWWESLTDEERAEFTKRPIKAPTRATEAFHRRRARKKSAESELFRHLEIYERDQWLCGICGDNVDALLKWPDPLCATLDHVRPLAKGGTHTRNNVQLAHWKCNLDKKARYETIQKTEGEVLPKST